MAESSSLTVLCLASYEKGAAFIRECKHNGCRVLLLTLEKLAENPWPRECIDAVYLMPDLAKRQDVVHAVSYLARSEQIDRIVALDDYDVETAAALREHLRCPGMGDTTARYFRDKLAMRVQAQDKGILVPEFVHVLNYDRLREYMGRVPPPWVLKPRSEASAVGIQKIQNAEELWRAIDVLGDRQSYYVLEHFIPGDVYHVDAITSEREVVFAIAHQYGQPPMNVAHEGGIFTSRTLPRASADAQTLLSLHRELMTALGMLRGVTHTEFIKGREDGRFYFLETAARVGGAYIAESVEAATGINLWAEWAKIEIARGERPYVLPEHRDDYAGLMVSLARQEHPDMSAYQDPEIVWRLDKDNHAGLIVAAPNPERVQALLDAYLPRFQQDFFATLPQAKKPSS
ncbi:MAG TPA: ATP-grasp domain-containing protein [Chloroflexia bacterium]|nr:ATP-grasp domain-containing protein [Chloroflexia bacterium]